MEMNALEKILFLLILCLPVNRLTAQTGVTTGCVDSSYHIRHYSLNNPFQVFRQIRAQNGGRIFIGQMLVTDSTAVMVAKVDKAQNIEWSKVITLPTGYPRIKLYGVAEAANENVAVSGVIGDNISFSQFYYAVFSASGNLLKQEMPQFPVGNNSNKVVHTICQRSADSLLFLYYSRDQIIKGKQNLCLLSCDNAGNAGPAQLLEMPSTNPDMIFAAATVSGNILNLYGSGLSLLACNQDGFTGSFTSFQYDLKKKQVIYHKTYCLPYTFSNGAVAWNPESIVYYHQRIFFLRNGNVVLVRPYQGIPGTPGSLFSPLFISYFDRSFTLLRNEYIQCKRLFISPTIEDLFIDSNGTKHISFSDYNNKAVYYAVADSTNTILLQKKMPITNFRSQNLDSRLQLIEPGMFTGFTTQNVTPTASDLHYVQLQNKSTADACFGSDTSFLLITPVPTSPNIPAAPILSNTVSLVHLPINCQVTDLPMIREDICVFESKCDSLVIHAPDTVCTTNNPVTITVYKNPQCKGRILFNFDTTAVIRYAQPNDTTLQLTFSKTWQGKIVARSASCAILQDSAQILVSTLLPSFTIGNDITFCPGKTYSIKAPYGFKEYEWQDGSTDSIFKAVMPGTYYVTATDLCNHTYNDTITIKPAGFSLSAGPDTTICASESIVLKATPGFSNYLWSPSYHISNMQGMQTTVFPDATTIYTVQAEKSTDCILKDSVTVSTKVCPQNFYIANAFSPNGDGKNETFKPYITGLLAHYEFIVFNRWGQQVFKTTNKNEGWNGVLNAKYQNSDVFAWVCKYQFLNQPQKVQRGTVVLIR